MSIIINTKSARTGSPTTTAPWLLAGRERGGALFGRLHPPFFLPPPPNQAPGFFGHAWAIFVVNGVEQPTSPPTSSVSLSAGPLDHRHKWQLQWGPAKGDYFCLIPIFLKHFFLYNYFLNKYLTIISRRFQWNTTFCV